MSKFDQFSLDIHHTSIGYGPIATMREAAMLNKIAFSGGEEKDYESWYRKFTSLFETKKGIISSTRVHKAG